MELRSIGFSADGLLELGAMVTYAQLMASSEVDVARPILAEVASTIGDTQVRNRGTVGGNVCVADPTNHERQTEALRALNAKLQRDERISLSMLPIGDGLTLARKRPTT